MFSCSQLLERPTNIFQFTLSNIKIDNLNIYNKISMNDTNTETNNTINLINNTNSNLVVNNSIFESLSCGLTLTNSYHKESYSH